MITIFSRIYIAFSHYEKNGSMSMNEANIEGEVMAHKASSASSDNVREAGTSSFASIASSQYKSSSYPPTLGSESPERELGEDKEAISSGQTNGRRVISQCFCKVDLTVCIGSGTFTFESLLPLQHVRGILQP